MIRKIAFVAGGLMVLGGVLAIGCDDETDTPPTPSGAACAPSDPSCPAISADCLALHDNTGKSDFTLRMSQLLVTAPPVLTQALMYRIISDGVNINLPSCNVSGLGTFCWLMHFDTATNMLITGGALPQADPTNGYCWDVKPAENIAPIQIAAPLGADGSFSAGPIDFINVPIYLTMEATSKVLLPLRNVTIAGQISADHNCIGSFNANGLEPVNNCMPDPDSDIHYFINGATLEGFIKLAEADTVIIDELEQSLCVTLSGNPKEYGDGQKPNRCKTDGSGNIVYQGDYCSDPKGPGGCRDSVALSGGIAASAVKLQDGCSVGFGGAAASGGAGGSSAGGGGAGGGSAGAGG